MKKFILATIFALGTVIFSPVMAQSDQNTVPDQMQQDMQQIMQMKASMVANRVMVMGIKMYMMGKTMMANNAATGKTLMSSGIKVYTMGMQMNQNKGINMNMLQGKMMGK